ncbi:kinase-like domain-containing protein [Gigaspora rosea]|uniref:Kinase-like domain-containing protein n=1 Tax=Gigaspora rosea TaxID=44941 RepID=A0A397TXE9_9GLOM|nr:kinase-like domain-containing protein [Gigaspora rosea]
MSIFWYMINFYSKRSKINGECAHCKRYNTSPAWCQTCDPQKTAQGWASGNTNIDDFIKEIQLKTTEYENMIEWIPFNKFDIFQKNGDEFLANWLDGIRIVSGKTQSREPYIIDLKILYSSQNTMDPLDEFMNYVKNDQHKVYGLTKNTTTNECMLVFDKFHSKRNYNNGDCEHCNRDNTSPAWCQTCDPQKTVEGWTSGNKNIDDCIKEFQLNSIAYESVIEWIPFNRLENIQKISDDKFGNVFQATWLDGKRLILKYNKRSRSPSYMVELKGLFDSRKSLKEFTNQIEIESDVTKIYGITQLTTTGEYLMVYERAINNYGNDYFASKRHYWNGKCTNCSRFNTSTNWCQSCDPFIKTRSGNKDIDDCIKEFQLNATEHKKAIEWIPFENLNVINEIGKGGFGTVYLANWQQDISHSTKVALKTLPRSKKSSSDFLIEFKSHVHCRISGSRLEIYGLTQNTETKEYMMVIQYANKGDLHNYLKLNFEELTWEDKLSLLINISKDLIKIHKAEYIHCDLHCGNILQHKEESWLGSLKSYVADLGLSRKNEDGVLKKGIYGIMPYIAPEVLLGQKYTPAADIYSFGVIMAEMTTGIRPFYERSFDTKLAIGISCGKRPEFALRTPNCYIELAKSCMHLDSQKRPTAETIYNKLSEWHNFVKESNETYELDEFVESDEYDEPDEFNNPNEYDKSDEVNESNKPDEYDKSDKSNEKLQIISEFMAADRIIPELSIILREHPDIVYASRFINTHDIAQYYKEISDQFNLKDEIASASNNIEIPNDAVNQ